MEKFISLEEAKKIVVEKYQEVLSKLYPFLDMPTIEWKKIGSRVAGRTFYETNKIVLNENYLYSESYKEFLNETPLHELAHYINYQMFTLTGHNDTWRSICYQIGLNGNRCHGFSKPLNEESKKFARKYYEAKCSCRTHKISSVRYNRIKNGKTKYYCVYCNQNLVI